jgi:hypothetical protein
LVLIAVWPLCAVVWLIQWPFVRFLDRAPKDGSDSLAGLPVHASADGAVKTTVPL